MRVDRLLLVLCVGVAIGWLARKESVVRPERAAAISVVDAAIKSVVRQPNQCEGATPNDKEKPMASIMALRELRSALSEEPPDRSSVTARLDELANTNIPPATYSIIRKLAKDYSGDGRWR